MKQKKLTRKQIIQKYKFLKDKNKNLEFLFKLAHNSLISNKIYNNNLQHRISSLKNYFYNYSNNLDKQIEQAESKINNLGDLVEIVNSNKKVNVDLEIKGDIVNNLTSAEIKQVAGGNKYFNNLYIIKKKLNILNLFDEEMKKEKGMIGGGNLVTMTKRLNESITKTISKDEELQQAKLKALHSIIDQNTNKLKKKLDMDLKVHAGLEIMVDNLSKAQSSLKREKKLEEALKEKEKQEEQMKEELKLIDQNVKSLLTNQKKNDEEVESVIEKLLEQARKQDEGNNNTKELKDQLENAIPSELKEYLNNKKQIATSQFGGNNNQLSQLGGSGSATTVTISHTPNDNHLTFELDNVSEKLSINLEKLKEFFKSYNILNINSKFDELKTTLKSDIEIKIINDKFYIDPRISELFMKLINDTNIKFKIEITPYAISYVKQYYEIHYNKNNNFNFDDPTGWESYNWVLNKNSNLIINSDIEDVTKVGFILLNISKNCYYQFNTGGSDVALDFLNTNNLESNISEITNINYINDNLQFEIGFNKNINLTIKINEEIKVTINIINTTKINEEKNELRKYESEIETANEGFKDIKLARTGFRRNNKDFTSLRQALSEMVGGDLSGLVSSSSSSSGTPTINQPPSGISIPVPNPLTDTVISDKQIDIKDTVIYDNYAIYITQIQTDAIDGIDKSKFDISGGGVCYALLDQKKPKSYLHIRIFQKISPTPSSVSSDDQSTASDDAANSFDTDKFTFFNIEVEMIANTYGRLVPKFIRYIKGEKNNTGATISNSSEKIEDNTIKTISNSIPFNLKIISKSFYYTNIFDQVLNDISDLSIINLNDTDRIVGARLSIILVESVDDQKHLKDQMLYFEIGKDDVIFKNGDTNLKIKSMKDKMKELVHNTYHQEDNDKGKIKGITTKFIGENLIKYNNIVVKNLIESFSNSSSTNYENYLNEVLNGDIYKGSIKFLNFSREYFRFIIEAFKLDIIVYKFYQDHKEDDFLEVIEGIEKKIKYDYIESSFKSKLISVVLDYAKTYFKFAFSKYTGDVIDERNKKLKESLALDNNNTTINADFFRKVNIFSGNTYNYEILEKLKDLKFYVIFCRLLISYGIHLQFVKCKKIIYEYSGHEFGILYNSAYYLLELMNEDVIANLQSNKSLQPHYSNAGRENYYGNYYVEKDDAKGSTFIGGALNDTLIPKTNIKKYINYKYSDSKKVSQFLDENLSLDKNNDFISEEKIQDILHKYGGSDKINTDDECEVNQNPIVSNLDDEDDLFKDDRPKYNNDLDQEMRDIIKAYKVKIYEDVQKYLEEINFSIFNIPITLYFRETPSSIKDHKNAAYSKIVEIIGNQLDKLLEEELFINRYMTNNTDYQKYSGENGRTFISGSEKISFSQIINEILSATRKSLASLTFTDKKCQEFGSPQECVKALFKEKKGETQFLVGMMADPRKADPPQEVVNVLAKPENIDKFANVFSLIKDEPQGDDTGPDVLEQVADKYTEWSNKFESATDQTSRNSLLESLMDVFNINTTSVGGGEPTNVGRNDCNDSIMPRVQNLISERNKLQNELNKKSTILLIYKKIADFINEGNDEGAKLKMLNIFNTFNNELQRFRINVSKIASQTDVTNTCLIENFKQWKCRFFDLPSMSTNNNFVQLIPNNDEKYIEGKATNYDMMDEYKNFLKQNLNELTFGFGTVKGIFNQINGNNILTGGTPDKNNYNQDPMFGQEALSKFISATEPGHPLSDVAAQYITIGPSGSGKTYNTFTSPDGVGPFLAKLKADGKQPTYVSCVYYARPVIKGDKTILREIFAFFVRNPRKILPNSNKDYIKTNFFTNDTTDSKDIDYILDNQIEFYAFSNFDTIKEDTNYANDTDKDKTIESAFTVNNLDGFSKFEDVTDQDTFDTKVKEATKVDTSDNGTKLQNLIYNLTVNQKLSLVNPQSFLEFLVENKKEEDVKEFEGNYYPIPTHEYVKNDDGSIKLKEIYKDVTYLKKGKSLLELVKRKEFEMFINLSAIKDKIEKGIFICDSKEHMIENQIINADASIIKFNTLYFEFFQKIIGTIKSTRNNRASSRSHTLNLLKIGNDLVPIIDKAGTENIQQMAESTMIYALDDIDKFGDCFELDGYSLNKRIEGTKLVQTDFDNNWINPIPNTPGSPHQYTTADFVRCLSIIEKVYYLNNINPTNFKNIMEEEENKNGKVLFLYHSTSDNYDTAKQELNTKYGVDVEFVKLEHKLDITSNTVDALSELNANFPKKSEDDKSKNIKSLFRAEDKSAHHISKVIEWQYNEGKNKFRNIFQYNGSSSSGSDFDKLNYLINEEKFKEGYELTEVIRFPYSSRDDHYEYVHKICGEGCAIDHTIASVLMSITIVSLLLKSTLTCNNGTYEDTFFNCYRDKLADELVTNSVYYVIPDTVTKGKYHYPMESFMSDTRLLCPAKNFKQSWLYFTMLMSFNFSSREDKSYVGNFFEKAVPKYLSLKGKTNKDKDCPDLKVELKNKYYNLKENFNEEDAEDFAQDVVLEKFLTKNGNREHFWDDFNMIEDGNNNVKKDFNNHLFKFSEEKDGNFSNYNLKNIFYQTGDDDELENRLNKGYFLPRAIEEFSNIEQIKLNFQFMYSIWFLTSNTYKFLVMKHAKDLLLQMNFIFSEKDGSNYVPVQMKGVGNEKVFTTRWGRDVGGEHPVKDSDYKGDSMSTFEDYYYKPSIFYPDLYMNFYGMTDSNDRKDPKQSMAINHFTTAHNKNEIHLDRAGHKNFKVSWNQFGFARYPSGEVVRQQWHNILNLGSKYLNDNWEKQKVYKDIYDRTTNLRKFNEYKENIDNTSSNDDKRQENMFNLDTHLLPVMKIISDTDIYSSFDPSMEEEGFKKINFEKFKNLDIKSNKGQELYFKPLDGSYKLVDVDNPIDFTKLGRYSSTEDEDGFIFEYNKEKARMAHLWYSMSLPEWITNDVRWLPNRKDTIKDYMPSMYRNVINQSYNAIAENVLQKCNYMQAFIKSVYYKNKETFTPNKDSEIFKKITETIKSDSILIEDKDFLKMIENVPFKQYLDSVKEKEYNLYTTLEKDDYYNLDRYDKITGTFTVSSSNAKEITYTPPSGVTADDDVIADEETFKERPTIFITNNKNYGYNFVEKVALDGSNLILTLNKEIDRSTSNVSLYALKAVYYDHLSFGKDEDSKKNRVIYTYEIDSSKISEMKNGHNCMMEEGQVKKNELNFRTDEDELPPIKVKLVAGMKVEADYEGKGRYYKGEIENVNQDGTYNIKYDNGNSESSKRADTIRSLDLMGMQLNMKLENIYEEVFTLNEKNYKEYISKKEENLVKIADKFKEKLIGFNLDPEFPKKKTKGFVDYFNTSIRSRKPRKHVYKLNNEYKNKLGDNDEKKKNLKGDTHTLNSFKTDKNINLDVGKKIYKKIKNLDFGDSLDFYKMFKIGQSINIKQGDVDSNEMKEREKTIKKVFESDVKSEELNKGTFEFKTFDENYEPIMLPNKIDDEDLYVEQGSVTSDKLDNKELKNALVGTFEFNIVWDGIDPKDHKFNSGNTIDNLNLLKDLALSENQSGQTKGGGGIDKDKKFHWIINFSNNFNYFPNDSSNAQFRVYTKTNNDNLQEELINKIFPKIHEELYPSSGSEEINEEGKTDEEKNKRKEQFWNTPSEFKIDKLTESLKDDFDMNNYTFTHYGLLNISYLFLNSLKETFINFESIKEHFNFMDNGNFTLDRKKTSSNFFLSLLLNTDIKKLKLILSNHKGYFNPQDFTEDTKRFSEYIKEGRNNYLFKSPKEMITELNERVGQKSPPLEVISDKTKENIKEFGKISKFFKDVDSLSLEITKDDLDDDGNIDSNKIEKIKKIREFTSLINYIYYLQAVIGYEEDFKDEEIRNSSSSRALIKTLNIPGIKPSNLNYELLDKYLRKFDGVGENEEGKDKAKIFKFEGNLPKELIHYLNNKEQIICANQQKRVKYTDVNTSKINIILAVTAMDSKYISMNGVGKLINALSFNGVIDSKETYFELEKTLLVDSLLNKYKVKGNVMPTETENQITDFLRKLDDCYIEDPNANEKIISVRKKQNLLLITSGNKELLKQLRELVDKDEEKVNNLSNDRYKYTTQYIKEYISNDSTFPNLRNEKWYYQFFAFIHGLLKQQEQGQIKLDEKPYVDMLESIKENFENISKYVGTPSTVATGGGGKKKKYKKYNINYLL